LDSYVSYRIDWYLAVYRLTKPIKSPTISAKAIGIGLSGI
jgi:hypothetical protein